MCEAMKDRERTRHPGEGVDPSAFPPCPPHEGFGGGEAIHYTNVFGDLSTLATPLPLSGYFTAGGLASVTNEHDGCGNQFL